MGCGTNRALGSPAEQRFIRGEESLLYSSHTATEVDFVHRKYSHNGEINENYWMNIYCQLNLAQNQIKSPVSHRIRAFYEAFKKNDAYILKELLILGILLSKDDGQSKARLMFEVFDVNNSRDLSRDEIIKSFNLIYKVTVKRAEILVDENDTSEVTQQDHANYMKRLKSGKRKLREHFLNEIIGDFDRVSLQRFQDIINKPKNYLWLSSVGFRDSLKDFGSKKYEDEIFDNKESQAEEEKKNTVEGDSENKF